MELDIIRAPICLDLRTRWPLEAKGSAPSFEGSRRAGQELGEHPSLTRLDLLQQDVPVPVRAGPLMVEAQSVLDRAVVEAPAYPPTPPSASHIGPAAGQARTWVRNGDGPGLARGAAGSHPSRDSMLSQSRPVLLLGLMQEKEEKESRPRVMMDHHGRLAEEHHRTLSSSPGPEGAQGSGAGVGILLCLTC